MAPTIPVPPAVVHHWDALRLREAAMMRIQAKYGQDTAMIAIGISGQSGYRPRKRHA
jgi:NaMN:DMB phosphoribosyltransferase